MSDNPFNFKMSTFCWTTCRLYIFVACEYGTNRAGEETDTDRQTDRDMDIDRLEGQRQTEMESRCFCNAVKLMKR